MKLLKALREARGWTRAALARRAGMGAADVGKIEAGRVVPYPSQVKKLARALRVTPDQLEGAPAAGADTERA